MDRKIFVVFVAGGKGVRMGADVPKQFLELEGKSVLQRTIETFMQVIPDMKAVTVLPPDCIEAWRSLCVCSSFEYPQILVPGGITRFHSVRNALKKVPDGAIVLIHDGVRPFTSPALIERIIENMATSFAVIPVMPVTDTLKCLVSDENGQFSSGGAAPDRSRLFGAQTPQAFRSEDLKRAYRQAYETTFTDDASVAEKAGIPITYISGERFNIKITTPEDMTMGKLILNSSF